MQNYLDGFIIFDLVQGAPLATLVTICAYVVLFLLYPPNILYIQKIPEVIYIDPERDSQACNNVVHHDDDGEPRNKYIFC